MIGAVNTGWPRRSNSKNRREEEEEVDGRDRHRPITPLKVEDRKREVNIRRREKEMCVTAPGDSIENQL